MNNGYWLRVLLASSIAGLVNLASLPHVTAQLPKPIERMGRIQGFAWGDGYHVCTDSKIRLGADLPPRSYKAHPRSHGGASSTGFVHRVGATFYDRFDATNRRVCDEASCDDTGCACAPMTVISGSQVTRGVQETLNEPAAVENKIPEPIVIAKTVQPEQPKPELAKPKLADPIIAATPPKKRPIRPAPPEFVTPRSITIPVASKRASLPGLDLPTMGIPDSILNVTTPDNQDSSELVVSSPTPARIQPVHPTVDKVAEVPKMPIAAKSSPIPTTPSPIAAKSSPIPTAPSPDVPSYAMIPPAPKPEAESQPSQPGSSKPQRLGSKTVDAFTESTVVTARPKRLGAESIQNNPFTTRPVVEMANRSAESSDSVIYQPTRRR